MSGKLKFEEPARIDDRVDGEIDAQDSLMIGQSAVVIAKIKEVSYRGGKVSREISASERIELYASVQGLGQSDRT